MSECAFCLSTSVDDERPDTYRIIGPGGEERVRWLCTHCVSQLEDLGMAVSQT